MSENASRLFQLMAGNPALDFVNTLDFRFRVNGPQDQLSTYDDLLRFVHQAGLLADQQIRKLRREARRETQQSARVLAEAKGLRETLAAMLYPLSEGRETVAEEVASLEDHFKEVNAKRVLTSQGFRFVWGWSDLGSEPAAPLWLLTQAAADLLVSDSLTRLRSCASDDCRWLFLDTSKNHTRRWCDMKVCGNRMKARRFHARLSGTRSPSP